MMVLPIRMDKVPFYLKGDVNDPITHPHQEAITDPNK